MDHFAHPDRLFLLIALVPLLAWVARGARKRHASWVGLGQEGRPARDGGGWRMLASVLVVVALAGPRWGRAADPFALSGRDVVVLIDVSRSMAAEDAVPDRLGVAVVSAASLLRAVAAEPGDRAAVVAFSGRGIVRCPMTFQVAAAIDAALSLRIAEVEPGGTDLGSALDTAAGAFDQEDHAGGRTIVVFSDGEDLADATAPAIARLANAGIVVHAVAIGDPDQAHPIPSGTPGTSLTYQGQPVASRRSDAPLDNAARATGGTLIRLGLVSADLAPLFRDRIGPVAGRLREATHPTPRIERFPAFAFAALACTLVGAWPGRPRFGRYLPALALVALGADGGRATVPGLIARGRANYDAGRFAEALDSFDRAINLAPEAAVPVYNRAATLFQLGRYPEAIEAYQRARDRAAPSLRIKIDFAMGNARLASGDVDGALAAYDDCLGSTEAGPVADAVRSDAGTNRAFALSRRPEPPPPDEGDEGTSPDPPQAKKTGGRDGEDRSATSPTEGPGNAGQNADPSAAPGSRGKGGRGGGGVAPPVAGSPGDRLDQALRAVREARKLRPADAPTGRAARDARDW